MELDGVITFFASHHAMRAERVLKQAELAVRLVPGPRELSPSCGVALRFAHAQAGRAAELLEQAGVQIEQIHHFPEVQAAPAGWRRLLGLKEKGAAT